MSDPTARTDVRGMPAGAARLRPEGAAPTPETRIREAEARLERRIEALESERARLTWALRWAVAAVLVAVGTTSLVLWQVAPREQAWSVDSLSTREIVLRDGDGVQRAHLGTDADGRSRLALSDRDGQPRIRLTVLADGSPGVTISDPSGRSRAVLGYLPDGTTNLVFADARGVSRAVLGLEADGSSQALFADGAGAVRARVGVGADGVPSVSVFDPTEEDSP